MSVDCLKTARAAEPTPSGVPGAPPPPAAPRGGIRASPLAKATAAEKGVPLNAVQGTGPMGRILQADVLESGAAPSAAVGVQAAPGELYTDIPHTQIRRV